MQTMVYFYESALVTCLSAYGTTLAWSSASQAHATPRTARFMLRMAAPVGVAATAFYYMVKKDYY